VQNDTLFDLDIRGGQVGPSATLGGRDIVAENHRNLHRNVWAKELRRVAGRPGLEPG
jgi:hypothetical protein